MSEFKHKANEEVAVVAQALSSGKRLELLDYLAQAPRSVDELAGLSGMSVANTSRHLQILRQTGLVEVTRQGVRRIYHMAGEDVLQLLTLLHKTARAHRGELDRLIHQCLEDREELVPLTAEQLQAQLAAGEILLLDVRPEKEYRQGHIPGARNLPIEQLQQQIGSIPRDKTVVAYCRGPFCLYAHQAVTRLRQAGIDARRLEMGLPEWRAAGKPVETQPLN